MSLAGKVALVTGGVKNLGAQVARELAGQGASLALHYHSANSQSDATKIEAELKGTVKVATYQADLTSAAACTKLFEDTVRDFGKVDIVVNTVGKVLKKPITEITEEEYDSMFAYAAFLSLVVVLCFADYEKHQLEDRILCPEGGRQARR